MAKLDLANVVLGAVKDNLRNEVNSYNPKSDTDFLRASLAADTASHMGEIIATALSKGEPITYDMTLALPGDSSSLFGGGGKEFGFFVENITGGYNPVRNAPTADEAFDKINNELGNLASKVPGSSWDKIAKNGKGIIKKFSYSVLSKWLGEQSSKSKVHSGFELKSYNILSQRELTFGGTGFVLASSKEEIVIEAIKKIYSKMNTLYLMSTFPKEGFGIHKKMYIDAADLFHELIFDNVITAFRNDLIIVTVSDNVTASTINTSNTGTFNVGTVAYNVKLDYSKLDAFFMSMGQKIKEDVQRTIDSAKSKSGLSSHAVNVAKSNIYAKHYNLFPGDEQHNFFHDVLEYIYANYKIYGILSPHRNRRI